MNYIELQQQIQELDNDIASSEDALADMFKAHSEIGILQDSISELQSKRVEVIAQGKLLATEDHKKDPNLKNFGQYWGIQVRNKWTIRGNALELLTKFATLLMDKSDYKSRGLLDDAITFNATKIAKLASQHGELTEFPFASRETIVTTFSEKKWQEQYEDDSEKGE